MTEQFNVKEFIESLIIFWIFIFAFMFIGNLIALGIGDLSTIVILDYQISLIMALLLAYGVTSIYKSD